MPTVTVSSLHLEHQLGKGFFGAVFRAQHPLHGTVAVKVMSRAPTEDDTQWAARRDGLLAEGQHLKSAEDNRVVRVLDVVHDALADRVYLILELCPGGSLQSLYEVGPQPLGVVRDLITDAALGLQCIHARDMLHRDIKPANILIGPDGRGKLGDFGLVTDELVLGYASAAGYNDHLAYEVWHTGLTSVRSDIWALGMTAFRMLHGELFYLSKVEPPRYDIAKGRFAASLAWLEHIPAEWQRFIRKCLHDNEESRYQSAHQVLQALAALPVEPSWTCMYTPGTTTWIREKNSRRIEVVRSVLSNRQHQWTATSYPLGGSGRARTLDSSAGAVAAKEASSGLRKFLTS
ncbi:serine/threonine-protein kinase [Longimicrobium sp.]|uniref:serine/threonine-protein kinase n=1 Tax=Longimicrobium sp. TaxID=2029185 RepID=UPI002B76CAF2|nr:serine/threonine-protein kinase [Longimicrobium sp.]HSU13378.1 serine/threonine-protein kinase [Longimicrobium sp.]